MNSRDEVILEYSRKPEGWAGSGQMCPDCGGGSSKEKSMRVTVHNGWLNWRCFRDSCQFKGGYKIGSPVSASQSGQARQHPVVELVNLPSHVERMLYDKYFITDHSIDWAGWKYAPSYNKGGPRVCMPILGPAGVKRGYSWRSYNGESPKAIITKLVPDTPMMCWYKASKYANTLVVVEDQTSALRLWDQGVDALALCGTLLTPDRIEEIKAQKYTHVFLCLDQDATATAVKAVAWYRRKLPSLKILPLNKDIKNMTEVEMDTFLLEIK